MQPDSDINPSHSDKVASCCIKQSNEYIVMLHKFNYFRVAKGRCGKRINKKSCFRKRYNTLGSYNMPSSVSSEEIDRGFIFWLQLVEAIEEFLFFPHFSAVCDLVTQHRPVLPGRVNDAFLCSASI